MFLPLKNSMKKQLLCGLLGTLSLLTAHLSLKADPLDVTEGYRDFKWGMTPEAVFSKAQELYGSNNVTIGDSHERHFVPQQLNQSNQEKFQKNPDGPIVVKQGNVETGFAFFQRKFISFYRKINVTFSGYVRERDVQESMIFDKAKNLFYSKNKGIQIYVESDQSVSNSENPILELVFSLRVTNNDLYQKIISELRAKTPSVEEQILTPLKQP